MADISPRKRLEQDLFADDPVRQMGVIRAICMLDADDIQSSGLPCAARLVRLTGSDGEMVRIGAAEALESGVPVQSDEILSLCELLYDDLPGDVSYWAATLIGRLGLAGELGDHRANAVASLQKCLTESTYLPARERAAWALGRIGQQAADAMPILRAIAEEAPPRLRRLAVEALESIRGVAA